MRDGQDLDILREFFLKYVYAFLAELLATMFMTKEKYCSEDLPPARELRPNARSIRLGMYQYFEFGKICKCRTLIRYTSSR